MTLARVLRGFAVAVLQLAIVGGIALYHWRQSETLPRMWLRADALDANQRARGRYVGLLVTRPDRQQQETVTLFIPETAPDPTRIPADKELWVEVSVPHDGPLRAIRTAARPRPWR